MILTLYPLDKAQAILSAHGVETSIRDGKLYALSEWTDTDGTLRTEWEELEPSSDSIRDFLNY